MNKELVKEYIDKQSFELKSIQLLKMQLRKEICKWIVLE